ncbi:hypothetical protein ANN_22863 [Periplaneta americana]|uniref:HTH psq-type domain-containing protein n=1 Tax=Periplaneta americana TaxID=6978 RepID=A0ABQ8SJH4_PERAM|nr:hypothetical protein ANN_22863 [Periplaneta americana]
MKYIIAELLGEISRHLERRSVNLDVNKLHLYVLTLYPLTHTGFPFRCRIESSQFKFHLSDKKHYNLNIQCAYLTSLICKLSELDYLSNIVIQRLRPYLIASLKGCKIPIKPTLLGPLRIRIYPREDENLDTKQGDEQLYQDAEVDVAALCSRDGRQSLTIVSIVLSTVIPTIDNPIDSHKKRPPSSSLSYPGPGNDDVRSPGSGGTPGPLSQQPAASVDNSDPEKKYYLQEAMSERVSITDQVPSKFAFEFNFISTVPDANSRIVNKQSGGSRRRVSEEKTEEIGAGFQRSPQKSIRHASRQFNVARSTVHRVLHKQLRLYLHKVQIIQQLKPDDRPRR